MATANITTISKTTEGVCRTSDTHEHGGAVMPTTVYPSRAGGFPPASFVTFAGAIDYVRQVSDSRPPCGICTCPVGSYFMHYGDTHL